MIRHRARLFLAVSGLLFCLAAHAQEKSPPKNGAKTQGEETGSTRTIPPAMAPSRSVRFSETFWPISR